MHRIQAAAWLACAVVACEVGAATSADQHVEVTGTRLSGAQAEAVTPVQVITRDDIARLGVGSLREVLDQIAAAGGNTSDIGGSASFAAGSSGASLRFLGRQATLVLLNGRRVAPYPLADHAEVFTNIDALPFDAIKRVEVLKIGGAALFGSDAVAGVINVITRSGWRGLQVRASREQSITSGRFGSTTASVSAGLGGSGSREPELLLNLELFDREAVMWNQVLGYARAEAAQRSPGFGTFSTYSWPGNIVGVGPLAGCPSSQVIRGLCRYNRYERFAVVPAAQRANLLAAGRLPLDGGGHAFGELLLADTRTKYLDPFQPYGPALGGITWGNPQTNGINAFTYRGLPATHPLNPTGEDDVDFRYRFVDAPSGSQVRSLQYRALGGVAGQWHGFDWQTAAGLMGSRTQFDQRGWFSLSGFHAVIGIDDPNQVDPQFFNRAYRIGQVNSAQVIDQLFPSYGYRGHVSQAFVDGRIVGPVAQWPAGPVQMAVGGDLRHERFTVSPSAELRSGDIVGNGLSASDGSRWVGSVFTEVELPLARTLQLQLAARADRSGNVPVHLSPKASLRWQATTALMWRLTAEGGFRAPNLTETNESTKFAFDNGVTDPLRCPQARRLSDDLLAAAAALPPDNAQASLLQARADNVRSASAASLVRHNANLKPETSRAASLGLVLAPTRDWKLSLDAWSVERHNEIALESTRELLAAEADRPAGEIIRAPLDGHDRSFSAAEQARYGVTAGALVATSGRFRNLVRTRTQGLDLATQFRQALTVGSLQIDLDATYLDRYQAWSLTSSRWGDNLAGRSGYARWRANLGTTLTWGAWSHTLRATAVSGTSLRGDFYDSTYTDENCAAAGFTPQECRTAGWVRWDWGLGWAAGKALNVNLHIANVFNRQAPVAWASWLNGAAVLPPTTDDARGRLLRLTLEWRL